MIKSTEQESGQDLESSSEPVPDERTGESSGDKTPDTAYEVEDTERYQIYRRDHPDNPCERSLDTYDYDWHTILLATKKYVFEYKIKNYEYMRTSQYFIRKQSTDKSFESDLATYCDMLNEVDSNEEDIFKDKIV